MDQDTRAEPGTTTRTNNDAGRQEQRYSALQTQDRDELADDTGHVEAAESPAGPPSYHLLDPGRGTKEGPRESTSETLMGEDDASNSYEQKHDGGDSDGGAHLPPRALTPLSNRQILLLFLELLAVVAVTISGIKGLTMLPQLDLFSVPPMTQDCGGYSVPAVERSFYINLQIARDLSFTRAKLLDLAWDTIVGQGGRFLHGWVLYQVAASQLSWMMEYSSVPYYFQLDSKQLLYTVSTLLRRDMYLPSRGPHLRSLVRLQVLRHAMALPTFTYIQSLLNVSTADPKRCSPVFHGIPPGAVVHAQVSENEEARPRRVLRGLVPPRDPIRPRVRVHLECRDGVPQPEQARVHDGRPRIRHR